ncbi:MAG: hypothetical protein KDC27_08800 [Acidobacteria bacterium]|nr:hypothetical protein [Acidobacteriota bacterium]
MMRLLAALLLTAGLLSAQFVEVHVDAGAHAGSIPPLFGLDAPNDEREAKLLLERGIAAPLRIGPSAAMHDALLTRIETAWPDPSERPLAREHSPEPVVWTVSHPPDGPLDEAVAVLRGALALEAPAAYYKRNRWFGSDGAPTPVVPALELASRLSATPQRLELSTESQDLAALAGKSNDGATVQVLLLRSRHDDDAPPAPPVYALYIRNLPWGTAEFTIERQRLDGHDEASLAGNGAGRGGLARITARLEGPAIELVTLRKAETPQSPVIRQRRRPN